MTSPYLERPLTKTKIVATVGPACLSYDALRQLAEAGVDVFRLNFAHADHQTLTEVVQSVRSLADELNRPIGLLGDLSGPKIRLGELPAEGLEVDRGSRIAFHRQPQPGGLSSSYDGLIDDLDVGDPVLLADGTVALRVVEKTEDSATCLVEHAGLLRSRQGINLPGVKLKLPSLTEKDVSDLQWAVSQNLDFVGLSFVRSPDDIRQLRSRIAGQAAEHSPCIVAKIEKPEAVERIDEILPETDAVMVARGDLGVEMDIVRVPTIQKRIIRACNRHRVPVITATQMLDSMEENNRPTRAEASDVANAVLDGSDAVMLSGETAIGRYPLRSVEIMSRIAREAEALVEPRTELPVGLTSRNTATQITRAVTLGAMHAAEQLDAALIVIVSRSGKSALAVSELRSPAPIVALTDDQGVARQLCLAWGVTPIVSNVREATTSQLIRFVETWARDRGLVQTGQQIVYVGTSDWERAGKDVMRIHAVEA
jgi:pyruvate kinase